MQLIQIQNQIYEIRGQKVMLDRDLAELYDVSTSRLNEAVKRNITRFPSDFMFQLKKEEFKHLISQNAISKNTGRGGIRKMPFAFTEQGVSMLSSVLSSDKAIEVNISIMRTFVLIRQHAINYKDLHDKLQKLEKKYNKNFKEIYHALNLLIEDKEVNDAQKSREPIGFKTNSK